MLLRRKKYFQSPQVRPLRPGPRINFAGRGRIGGAGTTNATVPLDADTSGSADVRVEQRHSSPEESAENEVSILAVGSTEEILNSKLVENSTAICAASFYTVLRII